MYTCATGGRERGVLLRCGQDWLLLEPEAGREVLIPLAALILLGGLPRAAAEPGSEGLVASRLDLRQALRAVVRDRSRVTLRLEGGVTVSGLLLRVDADHVEVAEDARVALRSARRDANEMLKELLKDGNITEDDERKGLKTVQETTDKAVTKVDEIVAKKEAEILEV